MGSKWELERYYPAGGTWEAVSAGDTLESCFLAFGEAVEDGAGALRLTWRNV